MEDWQGCLAPQCQTALLQARNDVYLRGGAVITVEDFLLALLDSSPSVSHFLRGSGVDMDELVRTIQCEQPIVTEVGGESLLSSQLVYWLATAREMSGTPAWLDWPQLLEVLAKHSERLQEKAYVAVMEQVSRWPESGSEEILGEPCDSDPDPAPVVITDPAWAELADDVAIILAATPDALVWVRGERGAGKTAWLRSLLDTLTQPCVEADLRRESELVPGAPGSVLVLDNITPSALLLIENPSGPAYQSVREWPGPVLLLGPDVPEHCRDCPGLLEQRLGRGLEVYEMPLASEVQRKAVLVAHQAAIERRWNLQLSRTTIQFAASRRSRSVCTPGGMLQWVKRAAARLERFARCGPTGSAALSGQEDTLLRQSLVAMARQESVDAIEQSLAEIQLSRAATEISWYERQADGTLHVLTVEDLQQELERWLAARPGPVHYVQQCN